ncbi:MAG: hypothetical protein JRH20_16755, partial [Deltaproteobacteria bacterium]|nr:hypothetical protein [Deltaproteobacteria bacterium]
VLPGVPCQNLGEALCGGTPGCELVQLGCSVSACAAPAPGEEPCVPEPPRCDYVCMPEGTETCESVADEALCVSSPECAWDAISCAMDCPEGAPCPPCPASGVCRTVAAPDACENLGATQCSARPDCEWEAQACPAIACAPDQPDCMIDCPAFCQSKDPVACLAIGIPEPLCDSGHPLPQYDAQGCLVGYECVQDCPPVALLSPECDGGVIPNFDERGCVVSFICDVVCPAIAAVYPDCQGVVLPVHDERGCLTGYECQECPAIPMVMIDCAPGMQAVPDYDQNGCLFGYRCEAL